MSDKDTVVELRRFRRLLRSIADLSQEASLTGALRNGAPDAIAHYNRLLERLPQLGVDPDGLFEPLAADAGYDRLGVAARLLSDYLRPDTERREGDGGPNVVIGNLAGLEELDQLKDIGDLVRARIADAFHPGHPEHGARQVEVEVETRRDEG